MIVITNVRSHLQTVRKNIRSVTDTSLMNTVLYIPIVLIIIMSILITWFYKSLPPQIPLYYSRPWGQDQLTTPIFLAILPLGCLLWYVVSLVIIGKQTYQYRVFSQILLVTQLITCLLALLVIINILHLII